MHVSRTMAYNVCAAGFLETAQLAHEAIRLDLEPPDEADLKEAEGEEEEEGEGEGEEEGEEEEEEEEEGKGAAVTEAPAARAELLARCGAGATHFARRGAPAPALLAALRACLLTRSELRCAARPSPFTLPPPHSHSTLAPPPPL